MLRQSVTENKASIPDTVIGPDGKRYSKSDFEDPQRPGYSRVGMLFSSFELQLCGKWNLVSPSGHLFSAHLPVPLAADSSRISREDAPAQLLEAAAAAWRRLEEIRARIAAALEKRAQAEEAHRRAAAQGNKQAYNAAISAEMQAEEERIALAMEEAVPRRDAAAAEEAIRRWMVDEGLYRSGSVPRPEPSAGIF